MKKVEINKSSVLSQIVGYTFLGTIILIFDKGLSLVTLYFFISFIVCIILTYIYDIRPTIEKYKDSDDDVDANINYQPIILFFPSHQYQLLIGLLCISLYFNLFNIELLKNFFLIYGILCLGSFLKNQFIKK